MQTSTAHPERGKTYFQGQDAPASADFGKTAQLEGVVAYFGENSTTKSGAALRTRPTGRYTKCILVRNSSASTTFAKSVAVAWEDGYRKRRVDSLCTAEAADMAGFVDDKLTQGARAGDLFWLMVEGYAQVVAADASYTVNQALGVGASGYANDDNTSPDIYSVGHVITAATVSSNLPLVEVDLCIRH